SPTNTNRSMAPKVYFLGAVRRRTMICCRNVKVSASSAARDRNRSTTAQTMSLKRSLITDQHRPILGQPPVHRFATGTIRAGRPEESRRDRSAQHLGTAAVVEAPRMAGGTQMSSADRRGDALGLAGDTHKL